MHNNIARGELLIHVCAGARCGSHLGWTGLLGLNRPCCVLEGLRGRKEDVESERREGKDTGSSLEKEVCCLRKVTGLGAVMGQVVRVLAEDTVKGCQKGGQEPSGCALVGFGWVLELLDTEATPSQDTYLLCDFRQMACPV